MVRRSWFVTQCLFRDSSLLNERWTVNNDDEVNIYVGRTTTASSVRWFTAAIGKTERSDCTAGTKQNRETRIEEEIRLQGIIDALDLIKSHHIVQKTHPTYLQRAISFHTRICLSCNHHQIDQFHTDNSDNYLPHSHQT